MSEEPLSILHVDMDAFYASVEQRDHPELRGKPVIVGGVKGRGVVCAASYEARKYGVRSAMPMVTARRLCPNGVYLPSRMHHYAEISGQLRNIFHSFTPLVEPLSLDEAFLDVRGCEKLFGAAPEIALKIRMRIKAETELTASVGVAPNMFLAKLASDHSKPDGLVIVPPKQVSQFLTPLPVGRLWGVGAKGEKRLHALGIRTIGELAALSEKVLNEHFGEVGRHLWRLANGHDDRHVTPDREAKSISTETTFEHDIDDSEILRTWLFDLVEHLAIRLRRAGLRARTVELKIRSSDFRTWTRATTLTASTNVTQVLWQTAKDLFARSLTPEMLPLRLLGVGASKLSDGAHVQRDLFGAHDDQRQTAIDRAVDSIREKFGGEALKRGILLDPSKQPGTDD